jgi:hypothetical protein
MQRMTERLKGLVARIPMYTSTLDGSPILSDLPPVSLSMYTALQARIDACELSPAFSCSDSSSPAPTLWSEAESAPPQSEAESAPYQSEAESAPPQSEAESAPPQSEAESAPPQSE